MEQEIRNFVTKTKDDIEKNNSNVLPPVMIKYLKKVLEQCRIDIKKDTILYRARIYDESDVYKKFNCVVECNTPFKGYDKKNSFVNLNANSQRCNSQGDPCLYVSTERETCTLEICNKRMTPISISEIKVLHNLNVVNLASNFFITSGTYNPVSKDKLNCEKLNDFKVAISDEINRPILNENYLFTQLISNYFRENGVDGLMYFSTCHMTDEKMNEAEKNIAIFNYGKCEAISSKLYLTENIDISLKEFPYKNQ